MNDIMATVRMPKTLFLKLKDLSKKKDYLDLSELIRSIVREKYLESTNSGLLQLKKLREDILNEVKSRSMQKVREQVNLELEKISKHLKEDLRNVQ